MASDNDRDADGRPPEVAASTRNGRHDPLQSADISGNTIRGNTRIMTGNIYDDHNSHNNYYHCVIDNRSSRRLSGYSIKLIFYSHVCGRISVPISDLGRSTFRSGGRQFTVRQRRKEGLGLCQCCQSSGSDDYLLGFVNTSVFDAWHDSHDQPLWINLGHDKDLRGHKYLALCLLQEAIIKKGAKDDSIVTYALLDDNGIVLPEAYLARKTELLGEETTGADADETLLLSIIMQLKAKGLSLQVLGADVRKVEIADPVPGSNAWIWDSPVLQKLRYSRSDAIAIIGKAGSGKSVLAKSILRGLHAHWAQSSRSSRPPLVAEWFYCRRRGSKFTTYKPLLKFVLSKILAGDESLFSYCKTAYRRHLPSSLRFWDVEDLEGVLTQIVQGRVPLVMVFDAIDESDDDNDRMVKLFKSLVQDERSRTKVIFLSRPRKEFYSRFWNYRRLDLQRENGGDVRKMVEYELDRLITIISGSEPEDQGSAVWSHASSGQARSSRHATNNASNGSRLRTRVKLHVLRMFIIERADGVILFPLEFYKIYGDMVRQLTEELSQEQLIIAKRTLKWLVIEVPLGSVSSTNPDAETAWTRFAAERVRYLDEFRLFPFCCELVSSDELFLSELKPLIDMIWTDILPIRVSIWADHNKNRHHIPHGWEPSMLEIMIYSATARGLKRGALNLLNATSLGSDPKSVDGFLDPIFFGIIRAARTIFCHEDTPRSNGKARLTP
ncbi:hypothetical protein PG988_016278 [Apiospora saccharicola]